MPRIHLLTIAVEMLIAALAAIEDESPLPSETPEALLWRIQGAIEPHLAKLDVRKLRPGWQDRLRAQAERTHKIGREPDEELGPWEHASEPMPHEDFATLRAVLEDPEPPSNLGHGAALEAARRLWDEAARGRRSSERYAEELSAGTLPCHELTRIAERLLRLEALLLDPDELAREPAESLEELRTMPDGAPLQLGRLAAIERALEQTTALGDVMTRIATALERAAGVQEWALQHPGRPWGVPPLEGFDEGEFRTLTDPCPKCGCRLAVSGSTESTMAPCPGCGSYRRGGATAEPTGWIFADEELPEPAARGAVLGWGPDGYSIVYWDNPEGLEDGWAKAGITHWQPLPAPPEEP